MLKSSNKYMKPKENIGNREPFIVPEGYFESLSERIMVAVHEEKEVTPLLPEKRTVIKVIRPYLALAAIVTGLAIISIGIFRYVSKPVNNSMTLTTELMAEEVDIYTIEAEFVNTVEKQPDSSGPQEDVFESYVIENVEETDIYDLL